MKILFFLIFSFILTQLIYPHSTPARHNSCACINQINFKKKITALTIFSIVTAGCIFSSNTQQDSETFFKFLGGISGLITSGILSDILYHTYNHSVQPSLKDGIGS